MTVQKSTETWWGDPYAVEHGLYQDYYYQRQTQTITTHDIYELYETSLEGWDSEIGFKIPGSDSSG